jgi:diguanylate cyclase (GGDEF)-like protein
MTALIDGTDRRSEHQVAPAQQARRPDTPRRYGYNLTRLQPAQVTRGALGTTRTLRPRGVGLAVARDSGSDDRPSSVRAAIPSRAPSLTRRIATTPLLARVGLCLLLLGSVALLDYFTGEELSFSVFYLFPVLFAGAFISRNAGRLAAVAGAAIWGYLEVTGRMYSAEWIPAWNTIVRLLFFLSINELVAVVRRAHERVRALSRRDSLTGIANARVFRERVQQEVYRSRRDGQPFTIAYVDLDRFKQVNDTYGHLEGDKLLRAVAETIKRELRVVDIVARLGGDEFGLLLSAAGTEEAYTALSRVAASLGREMGEHWDVGATFGAVTFVEPPTDANFAIRLADDLMYRGKSQGRGSVLQMTWPTDYVANSDAGRCAQQ